MIFLDVGSHEGQTLEEVTKPRYGFDRILAFEPMPAQYATLVERYEDNPAVTLYMIGLGARTGVVPIYGDNAQMEASLYPGKRDVDARVVTNCVVTAASVFFKNAIPSGERVFVKLNCEGAEIPILDDLLDSGEISKVANVMIDFDIRKVKGLEREEDRILARFAAAGFRDFCLSEDVMLGETHQERIAHWLEGVL